MGEGRGWRVMKSVDSKQLWTRIEKRLDRESNNKFVPSFFRVMVPGYSGNFLSGKTTLAYSGNINIFQVKSLRILFLSSHTVTSLKSLPSWNDKGYLWSAILWVLSAIYSKLFTLVTSRQGPNTFASGSEDSWKTSNMRFKTHMLKESKRIFFYLNCQYIKLNAAI